MLNCARAFLHVGLSTKSGDYMGLDKSTVSNQVKVVSMALGSLINQFVSIGQC